jgi:hypothetical protein
MTDCTVYLQSINSLKSLYGSIFLDDDMLLWYLYNELVHGLKYKILQSLDTTDFNVNCQGCLSEQIFFGEGEAFWDLKLGVK